MQRLSSVLLIALAACSSGGAKSAQTMPAAAAGDAGPTCAAATDHTIDLLAKDAPNASPELVKSIRDTFNSHCEKDQWSAATRSCFAKSATKDEAQKCEDTLSQAQQESLSKETVGGDAPGGPAPAPTMAPPPPSGASRGATTKPPKKGGDPEDGGD